VTSGSRSWGAFGLVVLCGCSSPFVSTECTEIVLPAVTVEVRELGTGRPLADSATGIAQTGTYTDSLRPFRFDSISPGKLVSLQAFGPAGTYRLELHRPGFQSWVREGVRVTRNRCGDNTVAIRADLTPR
jgi:hypothetical protein